MAPTPIQRRACPGLAYPYVFFTGLTAGWAQDSARQVHGCLAHRVQGYLAGICKLQNCPCQIALGRWRARRGQLPRFRKTFAYKWPTSRP